MGEIKRFDFEMHNYGGCDMCYAEMEEAEDGEYIEYEDHLKAIAEAKKEGVRRWLKDIKENCEKPNVDSCATCKAPFCMCGYLSDEVIQKVEA